MKTVHTGGAKPYACNIPQKKFKVKCHRREHEWCHLLLEGTNQFACKFCNKTFKDPNFADILSDDKQRKVHVSSLCGETI